jgi:DNA polymerase-3 subunit gamma/tau
LRDAWPEVLEIVQQAKLSAWVVLQTAQARNLVDDVLTVTFPSENDVASFKQANPGGDSVSEHLRGAIVKVLGLRVKFIARVEAAIAVEPAETAPEPIEPEIEPGGWAVAAIPESAPAVAPRVSRAPEPKPVSTDKRYGESVVREMLGASFIEEEPLKPRVVPMPRDE